LQVISRLVQRQSFVLALQDAFMLTLVVIGLAIVSVLFVRGSRKPDSIPEIAPAFGAKVEEEESSTPAFAMIE
jgi:hypothetical protein